MKTAEFGQPLTHLPQPGTCRICHCTEDRACSIATPGEGGIAPGYTGTRPCGWADHTRTLCDSPNCIAAAKHEIGR